MLDTDLVMSIVETFHRVIVVDRQRQQQQQQQPSIAVVGRHLEALTRTNRFGMAVMFLGAKEKKMIRELIDGLSDGGGGGGGGDGGESKDALRKKFGI